MSLATALCSKHQRQKLQLHVRVGRDVFRNGLLAACDCISPMREQALTSAIPLMNSSTRSTTAVSLAIFFWVVCRECPAQQCS